MSNALELKVIIAAVDKFIRPMKGISEASRSASKAFNEAKASLKGFNDQQKQIEKFRSANKSLGINAQDLEKARALAKRLGDEMQRTEGPTIAMQKAFKLATDDARKLADAGNRLREQKQRLRQELGALGIDTKNLSSHQKDLKGKIDAATAAVSRQDDALQEANKRRQAMHAAQAKADKIRAFGTQASSFGRRAMVAGAGISATGSVPVIAYAKAEEASTELKIAMMKTGGEVAPDFKQIDEMARRLGNKLPGTTADYQNMMTMLIRQGMPAKSILGGLGDATAYLAVALKMAPTAAAEFASKLQDATRTTDKDMMGLMDTIQRTFYLGVDQGNMLQGFAKLSPALSILRKEGLGAADALAPLLVIADQAGMAGEAAGNAYRKIFQMSLDTKKIGKGNAELQGTGVKLDFSDGKGEFGGLDRMYEQLSKLRGVSTQQRLAALKKIFGDDAETLQALTIMIEKGAGAYKEVQAKMAAQADIQKRVNVLLGTLSKLWEAASGTFTNALVAFGDSISPELHATAEWLGKVAERVQQWAQDNPALAGTLMTVIKLTGALALGIGAVALAVGALSLPLAAMQTGIATLGLTQAVAAVGGLAGKLGALVLAFGVGYAAGSVFNGWIDTAISKVVGYDTSLGSLIYDLVQKFKSTDWSLLGQWVIEGIEAGLDRLTFGLYSKVKALAGGIVSAAKELLGSKFSSAAAPVEIAKMSGKVAALGAGVVLATGGALAASPNVDTRPPLSSSRQSSIFGGGGTNSFVFHIQPSQGMDERALAVAVRNEFERTARGQEATQRSRLRDTE